MLFFPSTEFKYLSLITNAKLFGKLREYEVDMTRMAEEETKEKKSRGLALKSLIPSSEESGEANAKGFGSENLTLLVRKFKKFLNKKNPKGRSFQHKKNFKKNDPSSSNFNCFECGKSGHIKSECFIFLKKQQGGEKKTNGHIKKKAYIAWKENSSNTSSDSRNEEEANLCLMTDGEVDNLVSSSDSETEIDDNYEQLLDAFNEMHEKDKNLSQAKKFHKEKLRWHVDKMWDPT
ncbi:hypothetical protein GmHk_08G022994 [Glycine max]|nr:hypothetical protein GmHk_08G022994 [Glycine max]